MMGRLLARLVCRWKGHTWMRSYAPGRVGLRCLRCLAETPGLHVVAPPRPHLLPRSRRS